MCLVRHYFEGEGLRRRTERNNLTYDLFFLQGKGISEDQRLSGNLKIKCQYTTKLKDTKRIGKALNVNSPLHSKNCSSVGERLESLYQ